MSRFWWVILIAVAVGAIVAASVLVRPYLEQQGIKENIVDEGR